MTTFGDDFLPPRNWSDAEAAMYQKMTIETMRDPVMEADPFLQDLYHQAMFDFGQPSKEFNDWRGLLDQYLRLNYDVALDDAFDWEFYHRWYEGQ